MQIAASEITPDYGRTTGVLFAPEGFPFWQIHPACGLCVLVTLFFGGFLLPLGIVSSSSPKYTRRYVGHQGQTLHSAPHVQTLVARVASGFSHHARRPIRCVGAEGRRNSCR